MSKLTKPRLGRGLSSLISMGDDDPAAAVGADPLSSPAPSALVDSSVGMSEVPLTARVITLSVAEVSANPHQPRREFSDSALAELAASLKQNGVIQPIVVRQAAGRYELIAGERRLRAAKLAGLTHVPAVVKEVDGLTQAQLALVENIQREDLNPMDRASAYKALLDQLGLSHAELAMRLGEERSTISNHLRLLDLAMPVRELVRQAKLTLGHAKVLAGVADVLEQERLGRLVAEQELSVRNLERLIQSVPTPAKGKGAAGPSNHIKELEKSISRQVGMRVNVRSKQNGKGSLVIHYGSLDQFDELMGKLGVKVTEES